MAGDLVGVDDIPDRLPSTQANVEDLKIRKDSHRRIDRQATELWKNTSGRIGMVLAATVLIVTVATGCHRSTRAGGRDGIDSSSMRNGLPTDAFAPPNQFPSQIIGVEVDRIVDNPYTGRLVHAIQPYLLNKSDAPAPDTANAGAGEERITSSPSGTIGTAEPLTLWERQGLRVVCVPRAKVTDLMTAMVSEPVVDRTLMGVVPQWQAISTGQTLNSSHNVRLDDQIAAFSGGTFRLMMRAYPVNPAVNPGLSATGSESSTSMRSSRSGAAVIGAGGPYWAGGAASQSAATRPPTGTPLVFRVELIVQFHQPRHDSLIPDPYVNDLQGQFISSSAAAFNLDVDHALMITAESPDVSWDLAAENPPAAASSHEPDAPEAEGMSKQPGSNQSAAVRNVTPSDSDNRKLAPIPGQRMGPFGGVPRTVAEEAMVSPAGDQRVVVFIVPRVPRNRGR